MVSKRKIRRKKKPLISVVTVVFNAVKTLERTIKSVISQDYKDFEYVIIDGGSKDGSLEIIKKYDKYIDYWVSEPDKGIFDAMNKGVKASRGEYVYFVLADDYILRPDILKKVSADLNRLKCSVAYGQVIHPVEGYGYMIWPKKAVTLRDIRMGQTLPQQGLFMKRELMLKAGIYDPKYVVSGDRDLMCKCVNLTGEPSFLGYSIAFFAAEGKSSGFNANETAHTIYRNFGLLNTIIYYLSYSPLIFARYFLGRLGILRHFTLRSLVISYSLLFNRFCPFILVEDKKYSR